MARLPHRFFVTGTDTDVGKTVTSALLCAAFDLDYWKPIQSGTLQTTDSEVIRQLSQTRIWPEAYRLTAPISPHRAALYDRVVIDIDAIALPTHGPLLVEGAGGWMVPLRATPWTWTSALVHHLELPVVVVARTGLGTLNHTYLTLRAIADDGCDCIGVILVGDAHPDNLKDIQMHGAPILGHIPQIADIMGNFSHCVADLRQQIESA